MQPTVQISESPNNESQLTAPTAGHSADSLPAGAERKWPAAQPTELMVFFIIACLVGLGDSLYTQQIWEDTLITLRHSENLLRGEGLVYNPGERVHGFTSPINVLLLALCHLLTGQASYVATVWLYRIFSIAAFAGGGVFLLRATNRVAPRWTPAVWLLALLYVLDPKSVAYSTNGMETAFMLLFVGWAIDLLTRASSDPWLMRGLCWGGLMWTRPDGFLYIGTLALAEWLFFRSRPWRESLPSLAKSAGVCALVYSPWFLWAWWYYGSPIPQTVIAKGHLENGAVAHVVETLGRMPDALLVVAGRALRPIQSDYFDAWILSKVGSHIVILLSNLLGAFGLLYWLFPVKDPLGRAASFCFALLCLYFSFHNTPSLWYYPPATVFCMVAVTRALTMLAVTARAPTTLNRGAFVAAVAVLAIGQLGLFAASARAERIWQREIEDGQRAKIGQWLKENGSPGQSVYLEPLGYIGYFSDLKMFDFPGLVSPDVVRLRREDRPNDVIEQLKPDWVVLRYPEVKRLLVSDVAEQFEQDYHLAQRFDVNDKIDQYGDVPARALIRYDAAFAVFRKSESALSVTPPALPPEN